ncbi:MAG: hypothetical protein MUF53_05620 [Gemmatimonadaceae bacterium]|nr:hypothetical protein [Gemmatimonadaceae bacterium]
MTGTPANVIQPVPVTLRPHADDAAQVAEALEMFFADAGDHRDVGLDDRPQHRHLPRRVGADLHDGDVGGIRQRQQGERDTDAIVEVAAGRMNLERSPEGRPQQFLGRGLAVRSGHRDHRLAPRAASIPGEGPQRHERIADHEDRDAEPRGARGVAHHHGGSAGGHRLRQEFVGVEALAGQRHEDRPGDEGARIGLDGAERAVARGAALHEFVGERGGDAVEGPEGSSGHGRRSAGAARSPRTMAASSKGNAVVPRIW